MIRRCKAAKRNLCSFFRGVAQVVERYIRDVEAARSNRVTPIIKSLGGIFMDVAREDVERCKKVVGNLFRRGYAYVL